MRTSHISILLKKNLLTLKRNPIFLLFFFVLPVIVIGIFSLAKGAVGEDPREGSHFRQYNHFTSTGLNDEYFSDTEINNFANPVPSLIAACYTQKSMKVMIIRDPIYADVAENIKSTIELTPPYFVLLEVYQSESREEFMQVVRNSTKQEYCFAISIDKYNISKHDYSFSILYHWSLIPDTNTPAYDPFVNVPDHTSWYQYQVSGFPSVYSLLTKQVMKDENKENSKLQVLYVPMKTPLYENVPILATQQLAQNVPFFYMLTFLIPLFYLVSRMSEEKESKSREGMKIMGLTNSSYNMSWFIFYLLILLGISVLLSLLTSYNMFPNSNQIFIFTLSMLYGLTTYSFAVIVVSLINKQKNASTIASLLWILSYFVVLAVNGQLVSAEVRMWASLIPNVAMHFGIQCLFQFDSQAGGLDSIKINVLFQNYKFCWSLLMLTIDFIWMTALGLYLDEVVQCEYGVARPFYFCFTKSYWCKAKPKSLQTQDGSARLLIQDQQHELGEIDKFEPVHLSIQKQEGQGECLMIRQLAKKFGSKNAVDSVSLNVYRGQIFALLGHNGAGKTTTLSILTGLLKATQGSASIRDIDVLNDMDRFRSILGVCPQHDILFEYLTPLEHLQLFTAFKGARSKIEISKQVQQIAIAMDLTDIASIPVKNLSAGQKRKISVAIALVGNSEVILLDEPTSGMDIATRRRFWETLKQLKKDRIIILTTHYMDEADILGDRIGIMAEGRLKCIGSPLFLKNRFGSGYNLVVSKKSKQAHSQLDQFVYNHIEGAKKILEASSEVTYQLPKNSRHMFQQFFKDLDSNMDVLGLNSYGVSITTMEEVFLSILDENNPKTLLQASTTVSAENKQNKDKNKANCFSNTIICPFRQYCALLINKMRMKIRDPKTFLLELIFPIAFIVIGMWLSTIQFAHDYASKPLSTLYYPSPSPLIYNAIAPKSGNNITDLIHNSFPDKQQFSIKDAFIVPTNDTSIFTQMGAYDDYLYDQKDRYGGLYGEYFFYNYETNEQGDEQTINIVTFYNWTQSEALGIYGAAIHEAALRGMTKIPTLNLKFTNDPYPINQLEKSQISAAAGTLSALLLSIAFMMISDSIMQTILLEKVTNIKHQIQINGASMTSYWLAHYTGDLLFMIPSSLTAVGCIYAFNVDMPEAWKLFLIFTIVNPWFVYSLSFLFSKPTTGGLFIKLLYFIIGGLLTLGLSMMQLIKQTNYISNDIRWYFFAFPIFALDFGILSIANRHIVQEFIERADHPRDPLDYMCAGGAFVFLLASIPVYMMLTLLFEIRLAKRILSLCKCTKKKPMSNKQSEISAEQQQLQESQSALMNIDSSNLEKRAPIEVINLEKQFNSGNGKCCKPYFIKAIDKINFSLDYGDCFALLGTSGAGKTTTFKCLTGEIDQSNGAINILNNDISSMNGFNKIKKHIGYCPQYDPIFEGITVREHLLFYAIMKNIQPKQNRHKIVEQQIEAMDLQEYSNVQANRLSGGNKRKLSIAMAVMGNPDFIFLDEPSTGVDPKAKRFMWAILSSLSSLRHQSAIILSTHSMEEAEALCNKIAIMINGQFKCMGSPQAIKNAYGSSYEVEIKLQGLDVEEAMAIAKDKQIEGKVANNIQELKIIMEQIGRQLDGGNGYEDARVEIEQRFNQGQKQLSAIEILECMYTKEKGSLLLNEMLTLFKQVSIIESYNNYYKFKVAKDSTNTVGCIFGSMEKLKTAYRLQQYSVAQTSLEQIFNSLVNEANKNTPNDMLIKIDGEQSPIQSAGSGMRRVDIGNSLSITDTIREKSFQK